ncbi:prion-like-(Q/N-rich) domain-bearing protein 25 isoform X1 [Ischnura elegans]|uniref:prion-like-(Q/N-rich) domain-bearing protein 25 isoform X1 n=1 Tax=Ischnura elegans TaxID=197161 RepID=UPI001ED87CF9|nr:prion-like-(Q/N-rich) domain-bearing protein 25 isoform X1 [Ischnura elegans]
MRRFLLPYLVVACFVLLILLLPSGNSVTYGDIGSDCTSNSQCPQNSYCYLEGGNNTCVCNHPYTPAPNLQECLARVGTDCACDSSAKQCTNCVLNAFCNLEGHKDTCACEKGFTPSPERDMCLAGIGTECSRADCIPNASCGGTSVNPTCVCDGDWVPSETGDRCLSKVGVDCAHDGDCIENAVCSQGTCSCSTNFTSTADKGKCLSRIGNSCQNNDMCIEDAYCNTEFDNYTCKCNEGLKANSAGDKCYSKYRLGEPCGEISECGFWEVCAGGVCKCDSDHVATGNSTCRARLGKSCENNEECYNKYAYCYNNTCKCLDGYDEKSGSCKGRYNYFCTSNEDCGGTASTCKKESGGLVCACKSSYRYDEAKGSCISGSCGLDMFSAAVRALTVVYLTTFVKSLAGM